MNVDSYFFFYFPFFSKKYSLQTNHTSFIYDKNDLKNFPSFFFKTQSHYSEERGIACKRTVALNHEIEVDFLEHFLIQFLRILELDLCHVGVVLTMIDEKEKLISLARILHISCFY